MAATAEHVTMIQRSPSYVLTLPSTDPIAERLRRRLPARMVYPIVRWKNVMFAVLAFQLSRRAPNFTKSLLRKAARGQLPDGYAVDEHFAPRYNPWDQRMCFAPDGDLFRTIHSGRATIVTDEIETFTENGIRLASGTEVEADIVVTATGLNLLPIGGVALTVDGTPVELAETVAYKGMMLSGVPNFALAIGYTNASWTLKCDLVSTYVCRLLRHMDEHGYDVCTPVPPKSADLEPLIDLKSGYVQRSITALPRQGPSAPWRLHQNYPRDVVLMRYRSLEDKGMRFSRSPARVPASS
jgi:cation diffusion facilitator CzcD-associated flavoprotein CzcO